MAADNYRTLTSAILVPEALEPTRAPGSASPVQSLKRRQSSVSENDAKRPRVSTDGTTTTQSLESPVDGDRRTARRQNGQLEERKRGQRLFGALLGTLSQSSSSSSTAQKRRADIEKRQQAKLKLQAEEVSQRQHQQREELTATRRQAQKKYDEQSVGGTFLSHQDEY
jgi:alpha-galactosidase/6-phospho-beta-glucosidase family protein